MIRNALISSGSMLTRNNAQFLKTVGVSTVNSQQKRDQKTMAVVEKENPEKLPGSAFGWWVRDFIATIDYPCSRMHLWEILGSNQTGLTGPSLVSMTSWIGVVKVQSGHWLSVSLVAPSRWCTSPLHDTTWIVTVSSSELHLAKLMSSSSPEPWPTKWLQRCVKSTIKCPSQDGSSQWALVPTEAVTTITHTPSFVDVTESSPLIFTFLDVHPQPKPFFTAFSNSKRKSSAWRLFKCGTESKLLQLGDN